MAQVRPVYWPVFDSERFVSAAGHGGGGSLFEPAEAGARIGNGLRIRPTDQRQQLNRLRCRGVNWCRGSQQAAGATLARAIIIGQWAQ